MNLEPITLNLHIVSFDIPYPPNYGGVIDVYYKIKALHDEGVKVCLHCFEYHRKPAPELAEICAEVHYYPRRTGFASSLSLRPYIVESRRSDELIDRLLEDTYPILFEGLHSCFLLDDTRLKSRLKIYRESNIEHRYYYHLCKAEKNLWKKAYFLAESIRLKLFQRILSHADKMLVVSLDDQRYLKSHFPGKEVFWLPSFHRDNEVRSLPGKGTYVLYQANLSVPENRKAAEYILHTIYDDSLPELVLAGLDPPSSLIRLAGQRPNVRVVLNPDDEEMSRLIQHAQINLMLTFQATGLKLKLLNALFQGRFCLVNREMVAGTGLNSLCELASTPDQFRESIRKFMEIDFTQDQISQREALLLDRYSNKKNCKILRDILTLS
ncbi:MAG: glycosyltransferase family 1 protein [bacterium]